MGGFSARPAYSRAERLSDAVVHVIGVAAALVAVPVLVTLAVIWHGDAGIVMASAVYGVSLLAMLGCSAVYNITHGCRWTHILKRLDHSAIYIKIAGTYTPFVFLTGTHAGKLLVALWGVAGIGALLKIAAPHRFQLLGVAICLGMGWAGMVAGGDLLAALAPEVFALMLAGGLLYTFGVVFYLWASLPFHITIWHAFVLAATGIFYAAIVLQLGQAGTALAGGVGAGAG